MTTMSESHMRLHFLLVLFLSCVSPSSFFTFKDPVDGLVVACHPHHIKAFKQFKNEFDTSRCNPNDDVNGIWCDNATGEVTKLQLRACLSGTLKPNSSLFQFHQLRYLHLAENNFMASSLPSEFGNLKRLEVLSLNSNGFFGPIPSSFSNLSLLFLLDLSHNDLTGSFQSFRNLRKLIGLDLSYNHFSGTLNSNSSLFGLHNLAYLNIGYNNFTSSSLPSEFGNLNKLESLILSSNGFFGQVPSTLSNLTQLNKLILSDNEFSGNFSFVQNLTKLSIIELSTNNFYGTFHPSLFTMPFLSYLNLRKNNLNGFIELSNSSLPSSLEYLLLGNNNFGKQILEPISKFITLKELDLSLLNTSYPIDLGLFSSLKSLSVLDLSGNTISPASLTSDSFIPLTLEALRLKMCGIREFPNILKTLPNLEFIDLADNMISGKIPEWLWSLPRLNTLDLSDNLFTGFEGHAEILVNSSVQMLYLGFNRLQGSLPDLPLSIKVFFARQNSFGGNIPLSICNKSSLTLLNLGYNNFTGPVPPCISNLIVLNLRQNNLEGSIPDKFYPDTLLRTLDVGYNRLTGKLPRSLLNCSSLQNLVIDNNRIKDTFPFWLKALPDLQILVLRSNKFHGPISPPLQGPLGFPELRILEISANKFTGTLPPSYFENWKALTMNQDGGLYMEYERSSYKKFLINFPDYIDLQYKGLRMEQAKVLGSYATIDFSGNRLEGQIPESIGLLKTLIALNLSNNAFTGHIPSSFANLKMLESLDLSRNQLSGTIPNGLRSLSFLAYINVSHNQLKGEIPQGTQIMGQAKSSFEGNAGLCGLPLEETCSQTNVPPTEQPKDEDEEEGRVLNWKGVAITYGPGVLLGLAMAEVVFSYKPEWLVKIIGPNKRRAR